MEDEVDYGDFDYDFGFIVSTITEHIFVAEFYAASVGVPIIVLHLFICFFMMKHSTNTLIIAIGFCDLIVFLTIAQNRYRYFIYFDFDCINMDGYTFRLMQWIGDSLNDAFKRCSFWLGVALAMIRFLIMKLPNKSSQLSHFKVGLFIFLIFIPISFLVSALFYFGKELIKKQLSFQPGDK